MGKDWCIGVCVRDFMKCVLIVVHWALCATLGRDPVFMTNALTYNKFRLFYTRIQKSVIKNVAYNIY